ncbi:DUF2894 domain-containing protein [Xylophilus sp.]|uniref:DUF2894 domain-containing protein n=1 Tax=Xylophilus sp. TaxID=2653893 RepID=UPI0013BAFE62|nr:DUF2894 domain-containing protein [Xylophilus sp.]KAF1045262.1 MAG: hypothetical protein GAK38_03100 [Xylophilus sp.]
MNAPEAPTTAETLAAWRDSGADAHDPLRFRTIEALARRSEVLTGPARAQVESRLAQRIHTYAEALQAAAPSPPQEAPRRDNPLARLLADIRRQSPPAEPTATLASPLELRTLQRFRSTWARLGTEQRLRQSLAQVPPNAGPLNSLHLTHRALALMHEVAPGYLHHFVAHTDTLAWLDRAQARIAPAGAGRGGPRKRRCTPAAGAAAPK